MLDFIPPGTDLGPIAHELQASFGDEETKSQLDFQGIMNQLWTVMYKFNFQLSPEYAMVVRALGSLEGTATTLDPGFKVVSSAYPFILGRLLADPDPQMRETLRELLIRNNGSIRWHRLERLVVAVAEQSAPGSGSMSKDGAWDKDDRSGHQRSGGIRGAFDTHAVASATMDVISFILSGKGLRVRILLVKDIVMTFDALLQYHYADVLEIKKDAVYAEWSGKTVKADVRTHTNQPEEVHHSFSKWRACSWGSYGDKVFTNPLTWSSAWLVRLLGSRLGLWSSNEKDTAQRPTFSTMGPELAGHRSHSQGPDRNKETNWREPESSSSEPPQFDDFPERLRVGLLAFAKAVESDPEVWIPLMACLAAKPEARALVCDIASALSDSYCNHTAEEAILFMSKLLHEQKI